MARSRRSTRSRSLPREPRALPNQCGGSARDDFMTTKDLPNKIAVLMGGPGSERDVSLATGRGVSKALRSLGAEVMDVDVRDEKFPMPDDVELAFIALHGTFGGD